MENKLTLVQRAKLVLDAAKEYEDVLVHIASIVHYEAQDSQGKLNKILDVVNNQLRKMQ